MLTEFIILHSVLNLKLERECIAEIMALQLWEFKYKSTGEKGF